VRGLPVPGAELIAGIAVGDTSAVTPELDAAMKASSLSHLTAVSGANCALVVGIAFGLAALLGAGRAVRVTVGMAALAGFVVLVSPEPSVVRAAAMATIAMGGLLLGRVGAGVAVLCLAVVVLLVADPWLALSPGFALSAAATGSLLLLAGPLADGLARWMPAPLALALSIPLAAQLACGPLLVLIAPTVPLYGVLANLIAGPAAPLGTVLGLLACLAGGIPILGQGLAVLAWAPAAWIAGTATVAGSLPGNAVPWMPGPPGAATLCLVGGAFALALIGGRRRRRIRALAVVTLAGAVGLLLALGPLSALVERARTPQEWAVVACDVGQGDAVLLRSAGRVALVDTGPDPGPLRACLDRFSVDRIDLLILTHFDLDHRGGTEAVRGRVGTVLHGPVEAEDASVLDELAMSGARLVAAHEGLTGELGRARWRVLWPRAATAYRGNDASVVVGVEGGGVPRIVLLGDLSAAPQAALSAALTAPYDVVKVAHHGSADQSGALYERIGARVALVTVGENTYGHPREEALEMLSAGRARIMRTDLSGAIAVWGESGRLRIWEERREVP
jgi:competence protein ComEC